MTRNVATALLGVILILTAIAVAPASSQDVVTARGKLADDLVQFLTSFSFEDTPSYTMERNALDLRIPADGGSVTGTLEASGKEDVSEVAGTPCVARRRMTATFTGDYDGDRTLDGSGTSTFRESVVNGCAKGRYGRARPQQSQFQWTATVKGRTLEGEVTGVGNDKPLAFTANLSEALGGNAEGSVQDDLRGRDVTTARDEIAKIAGCDSDDRDDSPCGRAIEYANSGVDAFVQASSGGPGEEALQRNLNTLRQAAYLAALRGPKGEVLFPVARITLPVAVKLLVRSARAKDAAAAHRAALAAARFVQIVTRAELDAR